MYLSLLLLVITLPGVEASAEYMFFQCVRRLNGSGIRECDRNRLSLTKGNCYLNYYI